MNPKSRFIHANDITLHLLDWGNNGPPLLLAHSTFLCARSWAPMVASLADRFHVMALDLRGHGDSDKPEEGYTWDLMAADLAGVMEALDLQDTLLVGHSRGGGVTILGAALQAHRVKSVVLIEPTIPFRRTADAPRGQNERAGLNDRARRRRAVWLDRQTIFDSYSQRDTFAGWRPEALWAYLDGGFRNREDGQVELKCTPEIEAAYYEATISVDPWEMVARMTFPVLLVAGETSWVAGRGAAQVERFRSIIPHVKYKVVQEAGHFIPQQKPEETARLVVQFAQEVGLLEPQAAPD